MTITIPRTFIAASYAIALAGCPDRTIARVPSSAGGTVTKKIPTDAALDLLLVIDNSSSTADKQQLFADNFARFTQKLATAAGGKPPDLHVGVVSTSVGLHTGAIGGNCPATNDDGLFQNEPRAPCTVAPTSARFLADDGKGTVNYTGTLADALTCIARLGTSGCGFEAQLEAMKLALDGSQPQNATFLRDAAYLAVVFLTDEDDCSVIEGDPTLFERTDLPADSDFRCQPLYAYACDTPISATGSGSYQNCHPRADSYLETIDHYYDFLVGIKDPSRLAVALIAGDATPDIAVGSLFFPDTGKTQPLALQPSCNFQIGSAASFARPAIRLADFTSRFGTHGLVRSVCQSDYSGGVDDIASLLAVELSPCLEGPIDVSAGAPSCAVADVVDGIQTVIPPCATPGTPDPTPCYWIAADAAACATTATHLVLHVERGGTPPAPGTVVEASCQVVPAP